MTVIQPRQDSIMPDSLLNLITIMIVIQPRQDSIMHDSLLNLITIMTVIQPHQDGIMPDSLLNLAKQSLSTIFFLYTQHEYRLNARVQFNMHFHLARYNTYGIIMLTFIIPIIKLYMNNR